MPEEIKRLVTDAITKEDTLMGANELMGAVPEARDRQTGTRMASLLGNLPCR